VLKIFQKILTSYLYKQSLIALFLKVTGAAMVFLFNILLARKLGAEQTGVFFLAFTVLVIAVVFSRLGLDNIVLRKIAKFKLNSEKSKISTFFSLSLKLTFLASVLITIITYFFADIIAINIFKVTMLFPSIRVLIYAIVPFSLLIIIIAAFKGLGRIAEATIFENVFIPTLSVLALWCLNINNNLLIFLEYYILIFLIAVVIAFILWYKDFGFRFHKINITEVKNIFSSSMPLLLVSSMFLINSWADRIFLGIYVGPQDVGVYSIATKVALLVTFVLEAVNSSSSSKFSEFYNSKKIRELAQYAIKSTNLMGAVSFPVLILIIVFGDYILHIFGEEFITGYTVLVILCIGQFINVATGSVGQILAMTNREKLLRKCVVYGTVINLLLNIVLVPNYGMIGAAIATSIAWTITNVMALFFVKEQFNFMPILFNKFRL